MSVSTASSPPTFRLKPTRQPMLWAALAYSLGIVAGVYLWRPPLLWMVAVAAFLAAGSYFVRRRVWFAGALALGAFLLGGALHIQLRGTSPQLDTAILEFADGQKIEVVGHVTREGRVRLGGIDEIAQSLDVEAEEVTTEAGKRFPIQSGVRLTIYSPRGEAVLQADGTDLVNSSGEKQKFPQRLKLLLNPVVALSPDSPPMRIFRYGERIRFSAKLKPPRNFRNPGAFDYQGYLAAHGIAALASTKAENVELLPGFAGSRIERWRTRIHRSVIDKVHELWPPREAALIDAMVIGEEAFIDRDTRIDFQRSGTYHILVVSGMNVSILAFVVFWSLRRLRVGDVPATLLTILFCFAYAFLTEVGAPVWRATLMCTIYLGTRFLYRDRAMVNALGAAALGLLVFDPRQLFTASFQMTFVCVLIVAAIGLPILERSSQRYKQGFAHWDAHEYSRVLPPRVAQFRVDLRLVAGRMARFVGDLWSVRLVRLSARVAFSAAELIFVSAVMQMGLALPMAYYFHRATTIGLPANVVVVPLTQLLMPAAITAVGLGYVSRLLAKIPALLTAAALEGITGTVRGLGGLRLADLRVATPSLLMIASAAGALALAMILARRRAALAGGGLLAILAASFGLAFLAPRPQIRPSRLEMTSIDVGEGDSILLITPRGRTLLIDAGGPVGPGGSQLDVGEDVVSSYLWSRGICRLDAVAISHGHSDHIGGMKAVLKNFRPQELWVGLLPPSHELEEVIREAESLGVHLVRRWEGDEFDFGGARVSVLFPPQSWPAGPKPQNNDSMVLRVRFGESSLLLEGDAERRVERRVAAMHEARVDVLKVGHHGSQNATSAELLQAAMPRFAVISVGFRNSFGLPRREVLERLSGSGARVYRTDVDGAVTFLLDGHTVTPSLAVLR